MNISEEKKEEVIEAAKDAAIESYKKSKGLKWWERLLWIIGAGIAAGVSALFA